MALRLSFPVLVALLFVAASLPSSWALPCPNFTCGEDQFTLGKFKDPNDPFATPSGPEFLAEVYFIPGQMNYNYKYDIQDWEINKPFSDCYKYCVAYNKNMTQFTKPDAKAKYWMFERTCDEGGICTCYTVDVCSGPMSYTDDWMQPAHGAGVDFEAPANFTVGMLCPEGPKSKGDPHFTGADGSHFDFSGYPNRNYALISDSHFHVNGFFGGRYSTWKALTWIRSLAILSGHHTLLLDARRGPDAEYGSGYLARLLADGQYVSVPAPGSSVPLWKGASIRWVAARKRNGNDLVDVYEVVVDNVATLKLTLRPEVRNLRTMKDAAVHFGVDVLHASFTPNVHGVLGQTFRPDFVGRLEKQKLVYHSVLKKMVVPGDNAEGFIDGTVRDYLVSSLVKTNCRYCRFTRADAVDSETAFGIEMVGGVVGGGPSGVPRKSA